MANAVDSKSTVLTDLRVRVPPPVPHEIYTFVARRRHSTAQPRRQIKYEPLLSGHAS